MDEIYGRWLEGLYVIEAYLDRNQDVSSETSVYAIAHSATGGNVTLPNMVKVLTHALMAIELLGAQFAEDYGIPPLGSELDRMKAVITLAIRKAGDEQDPD